jgi:hypothetical protein
MHAANQGWKYIQTEIADTSDETLVEIKQIYNLAYFDMCSMRAWSTLRARKTQAFTLNQTTGSLMPSNMENVFFICDGSDPVLEWRRSDEEGHHIDTLDGKWYWDSVNAVTALASGDDVTVTANSTAVTSSGASFPDPASTDCTGEFIRFGDNQGIYEIAAHATTGALTLSDAYRGDTVAGTAYFEIRPPSITRRMLIDPADAETLYIHYWKRPLPLYNSYDIAMLPGAGRALMIKALQMMLMSQKYDVDAARLQRDYEMAEGEMLAMEPRMRPSVPRDACGNRLMFGRRRR